MNMFAKNSEASFVYNGVIEFIKAWESGSKSKLTLQSRNGQAWLNFNCYLGGPHDQHQKIKKPKSKKKQERDDLRAQLHQQRLQDGVSSTNSSSYFSKSNFEEKAASASRATIDIQDPEQVQADPASKTVSVTLDLSDSDTNKMVENKKSQEFKCELCDFVSNKATGLNIHMSRKHTTIEQLDGAADESFKDPSLEEKPVETEKQKPGDIENVVFPPLRREIDKIVYWTTNLEEEATEWKQMVLEDPSIDLFPIQWIFFKKAKVDMSDNDLIESWYRTAHSNYGNLISNISLLSLNCD